MKKPGSVYFISRRFGQSPIKIGYSTDPSKRLSAIAVSYHGLMKLLATMPGGMADEKRLHDRFGADHIRGEWFRPSEKLLKFIRSLPGYSNQTVTIPSATISGPRPKPFISISQRRKMKSYPLKDRQEILVEIDAFLKRTGESAYRFGSRVLGDKAFVWKLRNSKRAPWRRTVNKIMTVIDAESPTPKPKKKGKTGG